MAKWQKVAKVAKSGKCGQNVMINMVWVKSGKSGKKSLSLRCDPVAILLLNRYCCRLDGSYSPSVA